MDAGRALPPALRAVVVGGLSLLVALAIVGGLLSMIGFFRPNTVIGGTLLLGFALGRVLWRVQSTEGARLSRWIGLAAVAVAVLFTALNAAYAGQQAIVDRDPGVYNTAATLLAEEGTVLINPRLDLFEAPGFRNQLHSDSLSGFAYEGDRLKPQFANALPEVLAVARWLGGSFLQYKANAVLSGFALLVFFAFASRLVDPRIALAAMTALAVNPVFAWFARDSYSEILALIFIFGGLWALLSATRAGSVSGRFVAGLVLGATATARIDGALVLLGLATFLCFEWLSQPAHQRARIYATAGGAAAMLALAITGAAILSPSYLKSNEESLGQVGDGLLLLVGLTVVVSLSRGRAGSAVKALGSHREWIARATAGAVVVIGLYSYLLAPGLERRTLGPSAARSYGEQTVQWLGWYAGGPTVLLGILGLATLVYLMLAGRGRLALLPALLVFASQAIYFWDPHITPDQLWAMRRFLPVIIPMLLIGAAVAVQLLVIRLERFELRALVWAAAALLLLATLLPPLDHLRSLTARTQVPMRTETERLCGALGPTAAVMVPGLDEQANLYSPTIRATCRVPVAIGNGDEDLAFYRQAADATHRANRRLVVVSSGRPPPRTPNAKVIDVRVDELERVIGRPPSKTLSRRIVFWIAIY